MTRKGAIEVQFNWIFVLIAGALILALVIGFSVKWLASSKTKDAITTLNNIETIVIATGVVEGESKRVDIPGLRMEYDCHEFRLQGVSASGLGATDVFAPPSVEGRDIVLWTDSWFVPFYADNFVYLTTSSVKYHFVYQDENSMLWEDVEGLLPKQNLNYDYGTDDSFPDENYPYEVIVYLGRSKGDVPPRKRTELRAIEVFLNPDNISGTVSFYEASGAHWIGKGTQEWVEPELLMGAVVSGDSDIFECVYNSSMERVEIMAALLLQKAEVLAGTLGSDKYENAGTLLRSIHEAAVRKTLNPADLIALSWQNTILTYEPEPQVY